MDVFSSALLRRLKDRDASYYGRIVDLREMVARWLGYVPASFPNYTSHTVEHSDEIIRQVSRVIFRDGDSSKPTVELSALEAYVLCAAAYLHDAGMVVSDREKADILASEDWKVWTTSGGGAHRFDLIKTLREDVNVPSDLRHFLADVQIRYLVAELVRSTHARRAADVIEQHHSTLAQFDFGDPVLRRTVAAVCVGHGLSPWELQDPLHYPDRRDIRDEPINVRFVAILLRIGDLLDMSTDRACPLLLSAASPLPASSLAHWTKYQRFTHQLTAPDAIQLRAECQTQEEHRLLQDWCQWLVEEVRAASVLMATVSRHRGWQPPKADMEGAEPTIVIAPAQRATYIPLRWRLELDPEAVFDRLVHDVYDEPLAVVRELVQNALDATRCRLYSELTPTDGNVPNSPTEIAAELRERYPVEISLGTREVVNDLSGETQTRNVLVIEDLGVGMDQDIVRRYLLQVGRSYYTSEEFRRRYRFVPSSRFGIGFLSVFNVSDEVVVDTYKIGSEPLKLTLTGPRNYLLTERGTRRLPGTRVELLLRASVADFDLTAWAHASLRKVEFPVVVKTQVQKEVIRAESPNDFVYDLPSVAGVGESMRLTAYAVDRPGLEGELYVFSYVDATGERWDRWDWAVGAYPETSPRAQAPTLPIAIRCLNGILLTEESYPRSGFSARIDYRGGQQQTNLARTHLRVGRHSGRATETQLSARWDELLSEHLRNCSIANGDAGWRYKQRLVDRVGSTSFWRSEPRTFPVYIRGAFESWSFEQLAAVEIYTTCTRPPTIIDDITAKAGEKVEVPPSALPAPALLGDDLREIDPGLLGALFRERVASTARLLDDGRLALDWISPGSQVAQRALALSRRPLQIVDLSDRADLVGFRLHRTTDSVYDCLLLNDAHPFVQWIVRFEAACRTHTEGLDETQFARLGRLLESPLWYEGSGLEKLRAYLEGLRQELGLSGPLRPPPWPLPRTAFQFAARPSTFGRGDDDVDPDEGEIRE